MTEKQVTLTGIENKWIYSEEKGDYPKITAPDGCFYCFSFSIDAQQLCEELNKMQDKINQLNNENEQLKKENQQYKALLQDMGLLMSGEDVMAIRNNFADKIIKPIFAESGFDVDVDTSNGFAISLKEEKE